MNGKIMNTTEIPEEVIKQWEEFALQGYGYSVERQIGYVEGRKHQYLTQSPVVSLEQFEKIADRFGLWCYHFQNPPGGFTEWSQTPEGRQLLQSQPEKTSEEISQWIKDEAERYTKDEANSLSREDCSYCMNDFKAGAEAMYNLLSGTIKK